MSLYKSTSCPMCDENLWVSSVVLSEHCNKCGKIKELIRCMSKTCKFQLKMCVSCDLTKCQRYNPELTKDANNENSFETPILNKTTVLLVGAVVVASVFILYASPWHSENKNLLEELRKDFPSQRNETWYHFLSVLEKEIPSVKSITFLYEADKRTPECLTKKLVSLYSENKNLKSEDITFSASGYEEKDYGLALEHYRSVVVKFRVFVTDLSIVPGNIARIFHSLCDEVSSDIKPSLFVFSLKYDKRTERLKPLERAAAILKKAWSDLPENEIHPLLSRVIKNVVDVVPEKRASC